MTTVAKLWQPVIKTEPLKSSRWLTLHCSQSESIYNTWRFKVLIPEVLMILMEVWHHFNIMKREKWFSWYRLALCSLYTSSCEWCVGRTCDVFSTQVMWDVSAFVRSVTNLLYLGLFCGQISEKITQFTVRVSSILKTLWTILLVVLFCL